MINDVHIIYIIVRQANVEWLSPLPVVLWPGQVRTSIRRTIKDRGMGIMEPFSCLERAGQLPQRGFHAFSHFFSVCRLTFSRQKPSNLRQALFEESIGDNCQRGELWSRKRESRLRHIGLEGGWGLQDQTIADQNINNKGKHKHT